MPYLRFSGISPTIRRSPMTAIAATAPDWAALLGWICPDLSRDEAERLAVIGEASGAGPTSRGLKRLIEEHLKP